MRQEQAEPQPRRRPGGRSAKVKDAVVAATVAELEEGGYDKLSIAAVAARAGVHESSIYRRWKTREGLAMEATFASFASHIAVPDKGSLVQDLGALMSAAAISPAFNLSARQASRVMIEVMRCPEISSVTLASSPSTSTEVIRPTNWFLPLMMFSSPAEKPGSACVEPFPDGRRADEPARSSPW